MEIHLAEHDAELERVVNVLLELRTTFGKDDLLAQIKEQQRGGYQIAYAQHDGEVVAVAGFVIGTKLAWGKHIYVDDLVTAERHRSEGAGGQLIAWLKTYARELGCDQLRLDSGVQRFGAHRFYLREGFNIASHHFSVTGLMHNGDWPKSEPITKSKFK